MRVFEGNGSEWNSIIARLSNPHLLQTWEWGQVKAAYGWTVSPFIWEAKTGDLESVNAAAMVLKRSMIRRGFASRLCILYCSKGPLLDWSNELLRREVLGDLEDYAKQHGAIFIKLDPDVMIGTGVPGEADANDDDGGKVVESVLKDRGWFKSSEQIQFRNTVWLDISEPEAELLARMKQKTRYNVRLADKKGVTVRVGTRDDFHLLYKMYAETSLRNGFVIRDENYYRTVWEAFLPASDINSQGSLVMDQPSGEPLIAVVNNTPVAAVFNFRFAGRAYYLYGMSSATERELMPNYLLQWEAIKRAKALGCTFYDLWGAPDMFNERDALWDVFRFKQGFGGRVVRTLGAWDFPARPIWYGVYTRLIPKILNVMRSHGNRRTQQALE